MWKPRCNNNFNKSNLAYRVVAFLFMLGYTIIAQRYHGKNKIHQNTT
jgi:hypothetical protein